MKAYFSRKEHADISRYVERYGEREALEIAPSIQDKIYQHCLVIPAYNEKSDFIQRIHHSILSQHAVLLIVVINQPDNDNNTEHNQQLWDELSQSHTTINHSTTHHYLHLNNSLTDILLIDRFNHKIPYKQGVGLARKIGADIACQLIVNHQLSNGWIHHSDADTHLPNHYFSALQQQALKHTPPASAVVYPYTHIYANEQAHYEATQHYEQALAYYVTGLSQAGSPYAYHTLGSCIACNAFFYAQARGFPKKAGGEDFYLLNKLAKLGKIVTLENIELQIDARLSERVPFGTGPAVEKIMAMASPTTEYMYYHPHCFNELSNLLTHFECLFTYKKTDSSVPEATHYQAWIRKLSPELQDALPLLGIEQLFTHITKQIKNNEQCLRHCHEWLDAFKTLKLIHLLEKYYPKQALSQSITHWQNANNINGDYGGQNDPSAAPQKNHQ